MRKKNKYQNSSEEEIENPPIADIGHNVENEPEVDPSLDDLPGDEGDSEEQDQEQEQDSVESEVEGEDENPKDGSFNPQLLQFIESYERLEEDKKELSKAQKDIINTIKTQFGLQIGVVRHHLRLRKMDEEVRVAFEHGVQDMGVMLGVQLSLNLVVPPEEDAIQDDEKVKNLNPKKKR